MNKEEIIKALKKAVEYWKELCEQTEAQWAKEGVKGKVMCRKVYLCSSFMCRKM